MLWLTGTAGAAVRTTTCDPGPTWLLLLPTHLRNILSPLPRLVHLSGTGRCLRLPPWAA